MPRTRSPFNLGAVLALCQLEIPFCRFKVCLFDSFVLIECSVLIAISDLTPATFGYHLIIFSCGSGINLQIFI